MPTFQFTARDAAGRQQNGSRAAASARELAGELRARGWLVSSIELASAGDASDGTADWFNPQAWLGIRSVDVELALQQISVMLRSGLTLLQSLAATAENSDRLRLKTTLNRINQRIQEGASLAEAMAEHRCFDNLTIQLVRVGEQTGHLDAVLTRAAEAMQRRRMLKQQLVTALTYPSIVFLAAIGVTSFMVFFLIPKLETFVRNVLGKKLPAMTQVLIDLSDWLKHYGLTAAGVLTGLSIAAVFWYRTESGRLWCDRQALRVPLIGRILRVAGTALFARALGILIQSGVTVLDALRTMEELGTNRHLNGIIRRARSRVFSGGALAASLEDPNGYMPMLPRMVAVAEAAGTLDEVLDEVAKFYENQLEVLIRQLSALVEPAIIFFVGGVVGYVYIAFFLALYGGMGGRR